MHRVVQFDSKTSTLLKASELKDEIQSRLDSTTYDTHSVEVNDGEDLDGNGTVAVNIDFDNATAANSFYDWLKVFAKDNKAVDGSEGFIRARVQVHDCKHLEGLNEPCEIGNSDGFDLR